MSAPKCFCCGTEMKAKAQTGNGRPYVSCPEGCVQILVRTTKAAALYEQKYGTPGGGAPAPKSKDAPESKREEPGDGKAKKDVLDWD